MSCDGWGRPRGRRTPPRLHGPGASWRQRFCSPLTDSRRLPRSYSLIIAKGNARKTARHVSDRIAIVLVSRHTCSVSVDMILDFRRSTWPRPHVRYGYRLLSGLAPPGLKAWMRHQAAKVISGCVNKFCVPLAGQCWFTISGHVGAQYGGYNHTAQAMFAPSQPTIVSNHSLPSSI